MVLVRCWSDTVERVGRQFSEVIKYRFPEDANPKSIFLTICLALFLASSDDDAVHSDCATADYGQ